MSKYFNRLELTISAKELRDEFRNPEILTREEKGFPSGSQSPQGFSQQISWSHYRARMKIDNTEARDFYLKEKRAENGEKKVSPLGTQLEREFGRGFGEKNLRRMIRFAVTFTDERIVAAVPRQFEKEFERGFGIPTKALKETVKRNPNQFPSDFMFEISQAENVEVVTNCDHLSMPEFFPFLNATLQNCMNQEPPLILERDQ